MAVYLCKSDSKYSKIRLNVEIDILNITISGVVFVIFYFFDAPYGAQIIAVVRSD